LLTIRQWRSRTQLSLQNRRGSLPCRRYQPLMKRYLVKTIRIIQKAFPHVTFVSCDMSRVQLLPARLSEFYHLSTFPLLTLPPPLSSSTFIFTEYYVPSTRKSRGGQHTRPGILSSYAHLPKILKTLSRGSGGRWFESNSRCSTSFFFGDRVLLLDGASFFGLRV
jgi:hypothetical protein